MLNLCVSLAWHNLALAQAPVSAELRAGDPGAPEPGVKDEPIERESVKKKTKNPLAYVPQYEIIVAKPPPKLAIEEYGEVSIISANCIVLFFKHDKFKQQEIDNTLELFQSRLAA